MVRGAGIESAVWTAAAGDLRGAKAVGFCLGASVAEESSTFAWLFQSPRKHALAECTAELAECILAVRSLSMLKTSQSSFPRTKENPTLLLVHDTLLHQGMPAIPSGASLTPSILSCPSSSCFDFLHPLVPPPPGSKEDRVIEPRCCLGSPVAAFPRRFPSHVAVSSLPPSPRVDAHCQNKNKKIRRYP